MTLRLLSVVIVVLLIAFPAWGTTYYVNEAAPGGGDGLSWATAFNSLQDALDAATGTGPNEIWVAAGTYVPSFAVSGGDLRTRTFVMVDGVVLYGGFAGNETTIEERDVAANETILSGDLAGDDGPDHENDSENSYNVIRSFGDLAFGIDGFTIVGGNADGDSANDEGGGMKLEASGDVSIENCRFLGNRARVGGGAYIQPFSSFLMNLVVRNCVFENNDAIETAGGGLYVLNPGLDVTTVIEGCLFTGNSAVQLGGGAVVSGGGNDPDAPASFFIDDTFFIGNTGGGSGGGLHLAAPSSLSGCEFRGNVVEPTGGYSEHVGGGMGFGDNGSVHALALTRCLFAENASPDFGGALFLNSTATITLEHCTLAGNTSNVGSAMYLDDITPDVSVTNSILWSDGGAEVEGLLFLPVITYSDVRGGWAEAGSVGNIDADPAFADAPAGDYQLTVASPCIDAGDPTSEVDPDGTVADMGVYFFPHTELTFRRGDTDADGDLELIDGIYGLSALFLPGSPPFPCEDSADLNDDGALELLDMILLLQYLFAAGAPPAYPFPYCGLDPTPDSVSCAEFDGCP